MASAVHYRPNLFLDRDDEEIKSPKDLVLASVADALAEKIDENAKKSNLSTANVKSLLHVSFSRYFVEVHLF